MSLAVKSLALTMCVLALAIFASSAHAQANRYEALANSPMAENRPTPETAKLLRPTSSTP